MHQLKRSYNIQQTLFNNQFFFDKQIRQTIMSTSSSQSRSPIQIFHHKVATQLTFHLKKYHNPPQANLFQTFQHHSQHPQQPSSNFTTNQISQFLYDILQLQNSSIQFIMKEIFESDKRQSWHLEEILKTVLDVQFVITVNNSIVASNESYQQSSRTRQKEVSFIKIQPNELVQLIYDNCFFLQHSANAISKHLIQQIVNDINQQNGNKGYILLVEYKAYMLHHVIEKHNIRKFFTPNNRLKPLTPINKDKLIDNSQSIKEVDEESEIMGRSKGNFSTISYKQNQIKLDQLSKIRDSSLKEVIKENLKLQQDASIFDKVQREIWRSIKSQIQLTQDIPQQHFIEMVKQIITKKLAEWPQKYLSHLLNKLNKLSTSTLSKDDQIGIIIRLIGQQGFKIHHDQINSRQSRVSSPNRFSLTQNQLTQILENTFQNFIDKINAKKVLQQLAQYLLNQKGQKRQEFYGQKKELSFREYLIFIQQLSKIPTEEQH